MGRLLRISDFELRIGGKSLEVRGQMSDVRGQRRLGTEGVGGEHGGSKADVFHYMSTSYFLGLTDRRNKL
jgi:hypothetical protein